MLRYAALLALCAFAPTAFADDCTAELPKTEGAVFTGTVRYVGDGDSLCVGKTSNPAEWIEVRVEDFDAPELSSKGGAAAKSSLERVAMGKSVSRTVMKGRNGRTTSFDRVIARCSIRGTSVGDLLRRAEQ